MANSETISRKRRWAVTILGICLMVGIAVLFFIPLPVFETIHGKLYDLTFKVRGPIAPPSEIVIVAVDDDSLSRVGRWPWPRSTCAALINRLSQAGAKIIAMDIVFLPETVGQNEPENQALKEAVGRAGNVVLPYYFAFDKTPKSPGANDRGAAIESQSLLLYDDPKKINDYPLLSASNLFTPSPEIAQGVKALGHINVMADPDGIVRRAPMIIKYRDACYPSFSMQVIAQAFGLTRGDITVRVGVSVRLGKTSVPMDIRGMALVNYYGGNGTFRYYNAADVLEGKTKDAFRDRIVFVGITAAGLSAGVQDLMETPFSSRLPGVEKHAQEAASILQGRFLVRPVWVAFAEFGLILFIGLLLAFLLPVVRPVIRLIMAAVVLFCLGGLSVAAFFQGLWLKIFFPGALVILLYAMSAAMASRPVIRETGKIDDETVVLPPAGEEAEASVRMETAGPLRKIERYEILGELGHGAMGVVYKGRDPIIDRPVAIKTIRFDRLYEERDIQGMKERFFKEAQAAGKLIHPNIVTIFDVGDEKGLSFIAMECIEGKDLAQFIAGDSLLSWRQVCTIIIEAARALDYAHGQGVVHRDVKPANIMLTAERQVKVMDFGIAKIASSTLTQVGSIMGTPPYMSPEQINGAEVDGRSDLFSLGCVLYELLTGAKPFQGDNLAALSRQIMHVSHAPASTARPGIPRPLDDILDRALAKSPRDRFQTGKEMADALRQFLQELNFTGEE